MWMQAIGTPKPRDWSEGFGTAARSQRSAFKSSKKCMSIWFAKGFPWRISADIVRSYLAWPVMENTRALLRQALALQQRWQLSYWDAAVVAAAQQAGARKLWTEDLTPGQDFNGVVVVNPLL